MAATDPQRAAVTMRRVASIYALLNGTWTYVGGGYIDQIERRIGADGQTVLSVSGADHVRGLAHALVSGEYDDTLAGILDDIEPSGWTFTVANTPPQNALYTTLQYDTILAAVVRLAERAQTHWYLNGRDELVFGHVWADSGVRAIAARDDLSAEQAAIKSLGIDSESWDLATRVYPLGAGNSGSALTLAATSESAPTGYTLSTTSNYVESTAAVAEYGDLHRRVDFKDIRPVSGTDADLEAAANLLYESALYWLQLHEQPVTAYKLAVTQCSTLLRPLQTIRLSYRDVAAGIELDEDLYILEATWGGDSAGVRTTNLVVADAVRWPDSDTGTLVESVTRGDVYQVHPQMNANSYVIAYMVPVDEDETAQLRFRFDAEVLQVVRVTLDVLLTVLESTVESVGGESTTTDSDGAHTHTVSDHTHGVTVSSHTHDVTVPSHDHDIEVYEGSIDGVWRDVYIDGGGTLVVPTGGSGVYDVATTDSGGSSTPTSSSGGGQTVTSASGGGQTSSSGGSHTHDLTAVITAVYGIYRDDSGNLFDLEDDLEYSIDGSAWYSWAVAVNGYTTLGDGWVRVDLTDLLTDSVTYRPNQSNNSVRIRRKTAGATGKAAMINAQINLRTIIQAVALT
jgi:hypothetical protein